MGRREGEHRLTVRRVVATVTLAVLCVTPSFARAAAGPLSLRDAVAFAIEHSSSIAARRATVAADTSNFVQLRANELPSVVGLLQNQQSRSQNTTGSFGALGLSPANEYSQNTAQVSSVWNIFTGSSAQIQAQEAKRTLEAAQLDLRRAEQQLAADVTTAFYNLAARGETVRLDVADRAYQGELLDAAQAQERNGRIAAVDVLRAKVNALRSDVTLATARDDEANAREALAQQIGAPPDTTFRVAGAIPEPPLPTAALEALVGIAREHRSDVLSARATLAYARLTNANIDTNLFPQVQLSAAFGNQYSPTTVPFALNGQALGTRGSPGFWQLGATASLSVPLVDYGVRAAQHHSARALIDADTRALESAQNAVEVDIRSAYRGARTAYANLQTSKQAASLGTQSSDIAKLQYRNGLISLTDATQAEQSALLAGVDLVTARANYVTAIVRLRVAVGVDNPLTAVEVGAS